MLKKSLPILAVMGLLLTFPVVVAAKGRQPPVDAPRYGSETMTGVGAGMRSGGWIGGGISLVEATAEAAGEDVTDIIAALQSGDTYADIASVAGITLQDIVDTAVAARADALADAVATGRFTQEQADAMLDAMEENLLEQLNTPWTAEGSGSRYNGSTQQANGGMRGRGTQTERPMYRYDPETCPAQQ